MRGCAPCTAARSTTRASVCSGFSAAGSEGRSTTPTVSAIRCCARHLPQSIGGHAIGIAERDQWLACMDQAMGETGVDEALRARLRDSFFKTADWMRH